MTLSNSRWAQSQRGSHLQAHVLKLFNPSMLWTVTKLASFDTVMCDITQIQKSDVVIES